MPSFRTFITRHTPNIAGIAVLLVIVLALFTPMLTQMLWGRGFDYPLHLEFVKNFYDGNGELVSYPLFHLAVAGVYSVLPKRPFLETYKQAGLIIGMGLYLFTAVVLYRAYARPGLGIQPKYNHAARAIVVTLLLLLVAPVSLFSIPEGHLYWGYFLSNIHMNPTLTALKPFALLLFVYAVGVFSNGAHFKTPLAVGLAAILTLLATLAKPNFTLIMLPVITLVGAYRLWRGQTVNWRLLIAGLIVPATLILIVQYMVLRNSPFEGGAMVFRPFAVEAEHGVQNVALKFLLSILFPLTVYIVYKAARRDTMLNLAWLIFIAGAFVSYCFVEENRVADGNFIWSGQIAVTVLFAASMLFWLRQINDKKRGFTPATMVCMLTLALHGVSGVFWYYADMVSPGFVWY